MKANTMHAIITINYYVNFRNKSTSSCLLCCVLLCCQHSHTQLYSQVLSQTHPSLSLSCSVGRIGENPGNEVGGEMYQI